LDVERPAMSNVALKSVSNFGSLGSNMGTNIQNRMQPHSEEYTKHHPELFAVAHEYECANFQKAIQHVSRPGKPGIVLLKSPI
jgi:hypothetical protein